MSSTRTTTTSRSLNHAPLVLDISYDDGMDNAIGSALEKCGDLAIPPSPVRVIPAGKMLRRKKDMTVKRFSDPPSPISSPLPGIPSAFTFHGASIQSLTSESTPPLTPDSGSSLSTELPPMVPQIHTRTQSQPTPSVKLGHPSRPYYTAIRPQPVFVVGLSPSFSMSQPNITLDTSSGMSSRRTSLSINPPEVKRFVGSTQHSSFLDVPIENGDAVLPTPSALSPPVSLSGRGSAGPQLPFDTLVVPSVPVPRPSAGVESEEKITIGGVSYTFTGLSSEKAIKQKIKKFGKTCKRIASFRRP